MSRPDLLQHKLGTILDGDEQRDAVHIAVVPAQMPVAVGRGERLYFDGVDWFPAGDRESHGIVDPFLVGAIVDRGQWVLVWLTPNSITGLRHVYEHPLLDVPPVATTAADDPMAAMREIAERLDIGVNHLLDAADRWVGADTGDWDAFEVQQGSENWRDDFPLVADRFWTAYASLREVDVSKYMGDNFFSCSC